MSKVKVTDIHVNVGTSKSIFKFLFFVKLRHVFTCSPFLLFYQRFYLKKRCQSSTEMLNIAARSREKTATVMLTSPAGAVAKYCNEHVCLFVCVYVCVPMRVCLSASISPVPNHTRDPYQIFRACLIWPWLDPLSAG